VIAAQLNGKQQNGTTEKSLKELRVGHDVCLDLCLPFWKGCNPLSGSAAHKAITKMSPPSELNNNDFVQGRYKSKMADENENAAIRSSTHISAFVNALDKEGVWKKG
jgi:hypothetical protein